MRRFPRLTGTILAVGLSGMMLAACGSGSSHPPQTLGAAKAAVERLPFEVRGRIEHGVLIGRVGRGSDHSFRFFVFIAGSIPRKLPGVRGYERAVRSRPSELSGLGTTRYVFLSQGRPRRNPPRLRNKEALETVAIEDAICEEVGQPCPPI